VRVVFLAEPLDNTSPKSEPDDESLEAAWVSLEELDHYPLRGEEVRDIFAYVKDGGPVYPVSLLQEEGRPWTLEDRD
jgi:phosphatase NudJ